MIKIVALNNDDQDEDSEHEEVVATREAQEAIAENEYIRAIKLKAEGKDELSLCVLNELLKTQVLNEEHNDDKLWFIKYNCHKNIAIILEERCEYKMALQNYISAILIDNTDVYTLHKFGQLALKLNSIDLAEYAFENCLGNNASHWKAAEGMLNSLMYSCNIIGVYNTALQICRQCPTDKIGVQLIHEIVKWFKSNLFVLKLCDGSISEDTPQMTGNYTFKILFDSIQNDVRNECHSQQKNADLKNLIIGTLTWRSVGQFILDFHTYLTKIGHDLFFEFYFKDVINDHCHIISGEETNNECGAVGSKRDEHEISHSIQNVIELDQTRTFSRENSDMQPMDYNNDDSDSNAKSDGCETSRSKPRRRCSDLHFLEQWGWHKSRRYSSRKKVEKEENDDSLNCYLRRTFSKYMHKTVEGKWPFNENSIDGNSSCDKSNFQCFNCKKSHTEDLFQSETEYQFDSFLRKLQAEKIDLMVLIYKWLKYISLFWNVPLPDEIKQLYVDIFHLYICHFDLSSWNQLSPNNCKASYSICMFFVELTVNKNMFLNKKMWERIFHHLCFNLGICKTNVSDEIDFFELRLIYIKYLLFTAKCQYNECLMCLERMLLLLAKQSESFVLHLPNSGNLCINIDFIESTQRQYTSQIDVNKIPKLHERELWPQLADIIISNIESSKNNFANDNWFNDFRTIVEILLQSLWKMFSYERCLVWSEKCFHYAVSHYLEETKSTQRQKSLADLINFITSYIEAVILNEGHNIVANLSGDTLSRMVQNCIRILVYQFEGNFEKNSTHGVDLDFKRPWVILHQLVMRDENSCILLDATSENIEDITESVPNSFLILFTAHEYLGKRQWCSNDNGEFLQYILDAAVFNFKAPIYDICRDVIYEYIEQVTYCLFKYPQKKARSKHLEDHEASTVKLTWPRAVQVFDLYQPQHLPEFNSYKLESITSDMEQMLLKIISLIPKEIDPSHSACSVIRYIEGQSNLHPKETHECMLPYKIMSLYYLLADFYFKNRDFMKAIKFYTLDLVVNPTRFDSWAGMALSKASQIETKLNGLDQISIQSLWEECEQVLRCFECCITLNRLQTLLWIEYGSFCYTIHSYLSRYLKYNSGHPLDILSSVEQRKNKLLSIAHNCFSLTNSLQNSTPGLIEDITDTNDEKWLCQYMLGKISEKRKEDPKIYLNHYLKAANYLYESNATYPIKINHSNPTALSVEALEVFYRINASIIKYIACEKTVSRSNGDLFNKVLRNLSNSPFAFNKAKIDGNSLTILKRKIDDTFNIASSGSSTQVDTHVDNGNKIPVVKIAYTSEKGKMEVNLPPHNTPSRRQSQESSQSLSTSSSTSTVISTESSSTSSESDSSDSLTKYENRWPKNDSPYTLDELKAIYRLVVQNIEECATRFPEHYKSIYRLVYHFMNSPPEYCNLDTCEQLMMGQYKTSLGNVVNGLFYERKNNNLFNGIWRIPSSEIDRPGSFSAHLVKCVKIFILLLSKTNNHKILIDIALNLYKTPDVDKRYVADAARKDLYQQCISYSVHIMREVLQKNVKERDDTDILNLLLDIYKIHKKCIKYMNQKEPTFTKLLIDVYKFFIKDKIEQVPDNSNILDLAIKLCLQEVMSRKIIEKSNNFDSTTNLSDTTIARTFNIPGLSMQPKYRSNMSKFVIPNSLTNNTDLSTSINLTEIEKLQAPQFTTTGTTSLPSSAENGANDILLFQEYYANILEREKFSNVPLNKGETEVTNSAMSKAIYLQESDITPLIESDNLNSSQLPSSCGIKIQSKSKSSIKNKKGIYKPYNRSVLNDNMTLDNKKIELTDYRDTNYVTKYENVLFLNFFNNAVTSLPQNYSHINEEISDNKAATTQNTLPESTSTTAISWNGVNDKADTYTREIKSIKSVTTQFLSSEDINSSLSNKSPLNADSSSSPVKTLQQKLAERQKTSQLNELSGLSVAPKTYEDIIILD